MKWIKMEDFDYSRSGEVIMILKGKGKNAEPVVRQDHLSYTKVDDYSKIRWADELIAKGEVHLKELGNNQCELWRFSRAHIKNVIAFIFSKDLAEGWKYDTLE